MSILNSLEDISIEAPLPGSCLVPSTADPPITSLIQVSICTQTDVCALLSIRQPHTIGTNTTPTFRKDKMTQMGRLLVDGGNSPHFKMVSPHHEIQGWDSPVTSPPGHLDGTSLDTTLHLFRRRDLGTISLKPPPGRDLFRKKIHSHLTLHPTHLSGV